MSFAGEVWQTLSKIDVSHKVEKKGNLSYLSWAWAWCVLMEHYPASKYSFKEPVFFEDGSCEVWVSVQVGSTDSFLTHEMWLPVMDHRNKAIQNPDSRAISDTRMRCLTKCLAMFGLGHYIYAGEDLPEAGSISVPRSYTDGEKEMMDRLIVKSDATGFLAFWSKLSEQKQNDLYNSFEKGQITKNKQIIDKLISDAHKHINKYITGIKEAIENQDFTGLVELRDEIKEHEKGLIAKGLTKEELLQLKQLPEVK